MSARNTAASSIASLLLPTAVGPTMATTGGSVDRSSSAGYTLMHSAVRLGCWSRWAALCSLWRLIVPMSIFTKLVGDPHQRVLKKLHAYVDEINELEPDLERLSDEELRENTTELKERLAAGETLDDLL